MAFGGGGGIDPRQLGVHRAPWGGIRFAMGKRTSASTSTYRLFSSDMGSPYSRIRVLGMYGFMTGAGGALDTVQLQDKSGNAITEAVNVAALSDKDKWDASVIDDAYYDIQKGDALNIVTVSGALSEVWVELVHMNPEDTLT